MIPCNRILTKNNIKCTQKYERTEPIIIPSGFFPGNFDWTLEVIR